MKLLINVRCERLRSDVDIRTRSDCVLIPSVKEFSNPPDNVPQALNLTLNHLILQRFISCSAGFNLDKMDTCKILTCSETIPKDYSSPLFFSFLYLLSVCVRHCIYWFLILFSKMHLAVLLDTCTGCKSTELILPVQYLKEKFTYTLNLKQFKPKLEFKSHPKI